MPKIGVLGNVIRRQLKQELDRTASLMSGKNAESTLRKRRLSKVEKEQLQSPVLQFLDVVLTPSVF